MIALDELQANGRGDVVHRRNAKCGRLRDARVGLNAVFGVGEPMEEAELAARLILKKMWPCGICLRGSPWQAVRKALTTLLVADLRRQYPLAVVCER